MIKVKHILITFGYILTGINTQDNLQCRQIDFNNSESVLEFEPCFVGNEFIMKTYLDEPIDSCRIDSVNYLSNGQSELEEWSCFSSINSFTLDENTEFFTAISLQSIDVDDASFVEIQVFDMEGTVIPVINAGVTLNNVCKEFYGKLEESVENAKVHRKLFFVIEKPLHDVYCLPIEGKDRKVCQKFLNLY